MKPTSYKDVNSLISQILFSIQAVFHKKLVGFYLYGSITAGDFDHAVSDIDLLAVIDKGVTEQEFSYLKKMHNNFAMKYPEWKHRIEVAYLSLHGLQTFKNARSKIIVISPGEPLHVKDAGDDWLINWYAVQKNGIVIFGPNQTTLIPKITKNEYVNEVRRQALYWREEIRNYNFQSAPGSLAYAIFTMCRLIYGYKNEEQVSKKRAALWVSKKFPQWTLLLNDATAWRKTQWKEKQESTESDFPKVVEFVNFAINEIIK